MSGLADELERLRGPITAYCYRMLGSPHDAEDAVQETMVRAWRSAGGLDDPAGLRPWVFKIATNVCIDAANARRRRAVPMELADPRGGGDELGPPLPETTWVLPAPPRITGATGGRRPGASSADQDDPVEQAVANETIRLAFVAALQHLRPRQRAVLILRDVLRWRAAEVAELLDVSVTAVNSTLRRARATMAEARAAAPEGSAAPVDPRLLGRYVDAFERMDVDLLVALLHRDVVVSMPPRAFWVRGRDEFLRFLEARHSRGHGRMEVIEANGAPAMAVYDRDERGILVPTAVHLLEWREDRLVGLHAFLVPSLFPLFGMVGDDDDSGQAGEVEQGDQRVVGLS